MAGALILSYVATNKRVIHRVQKRVSFRSDAIPASTKLRKKPAGEKYPKILYTATARLIGGQAFPSLLIG